MIAVAPLFVSFWIFFAIFPLIFNPQIEALVFFGLFFVEVSVILGACPSIADITCVPGAFVQDVHYSIYQIALLAMAIVFGWLTHVAYPSFFTHEIFTYGLITCYYYGLKYGFRAADQVYRQWSSRRDVYSLQQTKYEDFNRSTHKPRKPRKLGIEEAQW